MRANTVAFKGYNIVASRWPRPSWASVHAKKSVRITKMQSVARILYRAGDNIIVFPPPIRKENPLAGLPAHLNLQPLQSPASAFLDLPVPSTGASYGGECKKAGARDQLRALARQPMHLHEGVPPWVNARHQTGEKSRMSGSAASMCLIARSPCEDLRSKPEEG